MFYCLATDEDGLLVLGVQGASTPTWLVQKSD